MNYKLFKINGDNFAEWGNFLIVLDIFIKINFFYKENRL